MDNSIETLKKYMQEPSIKIAMWVSAVILAVTTIWGVWSWIDDPPNADPTKGRVWIHESGPYNDQYDHYKVCVGPHLYEIYDMQEGGDRDHLDKEIKTSYAEVCESNG